MLKKLSSIRNNILFDFIFGGMLFAWVFYIFYENQKEHYNSEVANIFTLILYILLVIHSVFLIYLCIQSVVEQKMKRGIYFFFHFLVLASGLTVSAVMMFVSMVLA